MKSRILVFALVICLLFSLTVSAEAPADGTFEGTGQGFGGPVKVNVQVADGEITAIEVAEHNESYGIGDRPLDIMVERILAAQSYEVDLVSGATYSANALKFAVKDALDTAGIEGFDAAAETEVTEEEITTDVVVVGAGLAGISAAIEAKLAGSDVVVLEKLGRIGGNSILSGGIVCATGSPMNEAFEDDADDLVSYYQERANGKADEELLYYMAENSGDSIAFMLENGVEFNEDIGLGGTSPRQRLHSSPSRGAGIVLPLYEKAEKLGVEFMLERPVTSLISEDGAVKGVVSEGRYGTLTINAGAVVMAAGGFDADEDVRDMYSPHAQGAIPYTSKGNTGDYIAWAEDLGAELYFNDGVVGIRAVTATAYLTDSINLLGWLNTIAVTDEGVRFSSEAADYPILFTNMVATGRQDFYWIYDGVTMPELCELAVERNVGFKGETLEELAETAGMDPGTLVENVERYNSFAGGEDEDFGKAGIVALADGPYYAIRVRPATIGTMGGFVTNTNSEVLDIYGETIPGFYAAGECASGKFFDQEYPSSGTMLNIATVFGRTAGINAAAYAGE